MSRTVTKLSLATLFAASLLAGVSDSATAQEAMLLEQIGAVRMATPAEAQHLDADRRRATELRLSASDETMWFADAYTTAYYTLDQGRHELVVRFEAGPKGGNPIIVRRIIGDGAENISINGAEANKIRTTLVVARKAGALSAHVTTLPVAEHQASN